MFKLVQVYNCNKCLSQHSIKSTGIWKNKSKKVKNTLFNDIGRYGTSYLPIAKYSLNIARYGKMLGQVFCMQYQGPRKYNRNEVKITDFKLDFYS